MYKYAGYTKDLLLSLLYRAAASVGGAVGSLPGISERSGELMAIGQILGSLGGYAAAGGIDAAINRRPLWRGAVTGLALPVASIPAAIGGGLVGGLGGAALGGVGATISSPSSYAPTHPAVAGAAHGGLIGAGLGAGGGALFGTPLLWGPWRRKLLQLNTPNPTNPDDSSVPQNT